MRRNLNFALFLTLFSLVLYVANLVVYEAIADIFFVTSKALLITIGAGLGFLSASFIISTMLGSRYYNWFTIAYYSLAAMWLGCFVYLYFVSAIYGLLLFLPIPYLDSIGIILIFGALLVSLYGVLNARNIRITKVEVSLPHLPEVWRGRKAVWVSDLHLGQIHGPRFALSVVKKINSLPHDIVFIGGDLYDGTGAPDINELALPLKALRAPLGIYFVTGNHEEFGDVSRFITAIKAQGIHVLMDKMVEIDGLQLIGVDYHNASDKERFKNILSSLHIDPAKPSVLLKHEPNNLDVSHEAGISMQISGHTHQAQLWPLRYVAELVYKGYAYGLKPFKEMQVYTSSGTGTWGPPMRVGTKSEIVEITFK